MLISAISSSDISLTAYFAYRKLHQVMKGDTDGEPLGVGSFQVVGPKHYVTARELAVGYTILFMVRTLQISTSRPSVTHLHFIFYFFGGGVGDVELIK